jgi:hypothetical protein
MFDLIFELERKKEVQTRKKMPSTIYVTSGKWNSAIMGHERRAICVDKKNCKIKLKSKIPTAQEKKEEI